MGFPVRSTLRLTLAASLGVVGVPASAADSGPDAASPPPKVVFAAVDRHDCLQPVVRAADADIQDFRAAEQRWIAKVYPGFRARRWETVLVLPPSTGVESHPEVTTVQRETAHLTNHHGLARTVCFDVDLTERPPKRPV